jgi:hypothetical protein
MFEVTANGRPTGLTYTGRRARAMAAAAASDFRSLFPRTSYGIRQVY